MTRTDMPGAALLLATLVMAPVALHAQAQGTGAAGRSAARAIAARSTTSAARTASSLSTLGSGSSRATSVMGYLWAGEGTPMSNATVQLRNIVTGQIEQVSTTLNNGAFAFNNVQGGTYAIEYLTETTARVVAVGQAFSVAPGETVATFVRLGSKLVGLAGIVPDLASSVAQAAVSAAASAGIVGTIAPDQPASPVR